jgi:hypothetical protein
MQYVGIYKEDGTKQRISKITTAYRLADKT